ncbi:unnamed protein product, partial [Prorocentrum cordatum]
GGRDVGCLGVARRQGDPWGGVPASCAPTSGSVVDELAFLLGNFLQPQLLVTATAVADLPATRAEQVWELLWPRGAAGPEAGWLLAQPQACYGIPAPLQLLRVRGEA